MRIKEYSRYELKYLLDREQCQGVIRALSAYLTPDAHGDGDGRYAITSLYYDTADYKAYWDKIDGHKFRRKVRVRIYGDQVVTSDTRCFVEIKQRLNKTLQKKRVILPYSVATALCGAGEPVRQDLSEIDQATVGEVRYLQHTLQLQPACVVSYDRLAFEGSEYDPGLRVTFDTNLKGRIHDLSLLSQTYAESHLVLPPQWCVMEIKVNYRVPYWLTELIGRHRCTLRRISKYCTALEQAKAVLQRQEYVY
ncbi:MAG: VTC domain-containing protein [Anaerolineae bacterium]